MNISIYAILALALSLAVGAHAETATNPLSLQDLQAADVVSKHYYERALLSYKQQLREDGYDYEARVGLARTYIQLGDLRRASAEAEWLLARNRNDFWGLFIKGDVFWQQRRPVEAITYFWLAELVESENALLQLRLYQTLTALGDISGADTALRRYEQLVAQQNQREFGLTDQPGDAESPLDKPENHPNDDDT